MKSSAFQFAKLGIFVIIGLFFLIFLLYMIGNNRNLFNKTLYINSRFDNVHGLMVGNNVRFGGIPVGTVDKIQIVNDSTVEVRMSIKREMGSLIKKNALVSIGTEGFVGYRLINIENVKIPSPFIESGDFLVVSTKLDTDEMIEMLGHTISLIEASSGELNNILNKIDESEAVWSLLRDKSIQSKIHNSLSDINHFTNELKKAGSSVNTLMEDVNNKNGVLHSIIYDSVIWLDIHNAVNSIGKIGHTVDTFERNLTASITEVKSRIETGSGPIPKLLNDSSITSDLHKGLHNLVMASDNLNQNMEALKHNFLFRKYFKKLEKQKRDSIKKN